MHLKRFFCVVLVCMLFVGLVGMPVGATELEDTVSENAMLNFMLSRATGSFNMTIPAKTKLSASTSFPLAAGETVTIKASYSPLMNLGTEEITGSLQYSVTRAWP